MENYTNLIKLKRLENKQSQKYVAKKLGITPQYYGKLERDPRNFKLELLEDLADLWECDLNAFSNKSFPNSSIKRDLKKLISKLIDEL